MKKAFDSVRIATFNIRGGIHKSLKYKQLIGTIASNEIDILCLQELKTRKNPSTNFIPGFVTVASIYNKEGTAKRGSSISVKNNIMVIDNDCPSKGILMGRFTKITVLSGQEPIEIICIYAPNKAIPKLRFYNALKKKLSKVQNRFILVGDLNGTIGDRNRTSDKSISKLVDQFGLLDSVYTATQSDTSTHVKSYRIDYILSKNINLDNHWIERDKGLMSDHFMIHCDIPDKLVTMPSITRTKTPNYNKKNTQQNIFNLSEQWADAVSIYCNELDRKDQACSLPTLTAVYEKLAEYLNEDNLALEKTAKQKHTTCNRTNKYMKIIYWCHKAIRLL